MSQSPHIVIFCGAGFSFFAGLPLMSQFSDRLRESGRLGEAQAEFDSIQLRCDSLGAFIGGSARNLEQLASFLSIMRITRPDFVFPGCNRHGTPDAALRLVLDAMRGMVCPKLKMDWVRQETAKIFGLRDVNRLTFITTNYDLVIEAGAISQKTYAIPTPDVLDGCNAERKPERSMYLPAEDAPHGVRLFKLHGSVNWLASNRQSIWVMNAVRPQVFNRAVNEWDTDFTEGRPGVQDFLMVPPSVLKPQIGERLSPQWRGASDAIADADHLWFVGYSFPETDSFMRYFLASSLATNAKLKQLAVIDPSRDVCRRARALFRLPSLEEVFRALPVPWTDVNFSALLGRDYQGACAGSISDLQTRRIFDEALRLD